MQADEDAVDLLARMVRFDPAQRVTAADALQHPFFTRGAAPTQPARLPRPKSRKDAPLALAPTRPPPTTDPVLTGAAKAPRATAGVRATHSYLSLNVAFDVSLA